MEALNKSLGTIYFYIKDGVIFAIEPYNNGDQCAKKGVSAITEENKQVLVPFITVTKDRVSTNYFLTNFIYDGDMYKNNAFQHHAHEESDGVSINVYYHNQCMKQIKETIKNNPKEGYKYFNDNKNVFDIPPFMFANNGYTVSNVNQINFTERNFDIWKGEVVQEEAYNAAKARAKEFNYKVTSGILDLTVQKIT